MSAITFLYLLDNDTSNVILMSTGVGLAIELWKAHKVCAVSLAWRGTRLPRLAFTARGGFAHTATATYDAQAAEYVAWALLPLVAGTSAYSVCYSAHKSWYSWLLSSLVSAVYSFGFAQQAPQLFINYKLKSTAHMPWKTLCYKVRKAKRSSPGAAPRPGRVRLTRAPRSPACRPPGAQHVHRRPVRLHHQDAHHAPARLP